MTTIVPCVQKRIYGVNDRCGESTSTNAHARLRCQVIINDDETFLTPLGRARSQPARNAVIGQRRIGK